MPLGATVIYSAGGYLKHSLSALDSFNPETGEWHTLKELPNPKSGAGAAFVGELWQSGFQSIDPHSLVLD